MQDNVEYDFDNESISKSQRKRDMQALQELGIKLTQLSPAALSTIPLEPVLYDAIVEAGKIHEKSGKKRHLQFIGKLMRQADGEAIQEALDKLDDVKKRTARQLHVVEEWRDRLLSEEPTVLSDFFTQYNHADRQLIRNLLRSAIKEKEQKKPPANARKLFKYLRDIIITDTNNS